MVKHVVLFRMKDFATTTERVEKLTEIKLALEALTNEIEIIKSIEVGINANPDEDYDLSLSVVLEQMSDVALYANHPAHVAVAKNLIAPIKAARACVDYVIE